MGIITLIALGFLLTIPLIIYMFRSYEIISCHETDDGKSLVVAKLGRKTTVFVRLDDRYGCLWYDNQGSYPKTPGGVYFERTWDVQKSLGKVTDWEGN